MLGALGIAFNVLHTNRLAKEVRRFLLIRAALLSGIAINNGTLRFSQAGKGHRLLT